MDGSDLYLEREQTLVKHLILRHYLQRFAQIVGKFNDAITYVDCFSGPWNVRSEEMRDSSFAIALDELRKAKENYPQLKLRCYFLEKDRDAYSKLKRYADLISDVEVKTRNSDLEGSVSQILDFVQRGGKRSFPFIFIDPTGWTGFEMKTITPLLSLTPGEVLINFMTGHIKRFIDSPNEMTKESFTGLFGSGDYRAKLQGLARKEQEEALVQAYADNVKQVGNYKYVCTAIVLHPEIDKTHFHLIYGTRHAKGVEVFKDTEKRAMKAMEKARADSQQRKREFKTHSKDLFESEVCYTSTLYDELRERFLSRTKQQLRQMLEQKGRVEYDVAWLTVASYPLVWESDLKSWIKEWMEEGLTIEGMLPRQRVPKLNSGLWLCWPVAQ